MADAARQVEGDKQRDRVEAVADVVSRVGQEGNAAGHHNDDNLQDGGDGQRGQRDPDCADAEVVVSEGGVGGQGLLLVAVAVQVEDLVYPAPDAVTVVMVVVLAMVVSMVMLRVRGHVCDHRHACDREDDRGRQGSCRARVRVDAERLTFSVPVLIVYGVGSVAARDAGRG